MKTKLDRTDYIILLIFYILSAVLNTFDYLDQETKIIEYFIDIPMFIITSYLGVLMFMYYIIPHFLIRKKRYILFGVIGLITVCSIGIIEKVTGHWSAGALWSKFPNLKDLLLYATFNGADSVGLPMGILLTKKFYEGQILVTKTKQEQKENELKLLRSQIDPHFLFNNLNTLDSLIDSDSEKAKEYINRLSLIYRYLIQTKDSEVMELSKELEFAENYMFLIKTRFGEDYDFKIDAKASSTDKFIPTGAIQSLLENVVKHNKPKNNEAIDTLVIIEDQWLKVTNTKSTIKTKNESFGTGLKNLKTRYQLLSDKEIHIENTKEKFEVAIPIIGLSD